MKHTPGTSTHLNADYVVSLTLMTKSSIIAGHSSVLFSRRDHETGEMVVEEAASLYSEVISKKGWFDGKPYNTYKAETPNGIVKQEVIKFLCGEGVLHHSFAVSEENYIKMITKVRQDIAKGQHTYYEWLATNCKRYCEKVVQDASKTKAALSPYVLSPHLRFNLLGWGEVKYEGVSVPVWSGHDPDSHNYLRLKAQQSPPDFISLPQGVSVADPTTVTQYAPKELMGDAAAVVDVSDKKVALGAIENVRLTWMSPCALHKTEKSATPLNQASGQLWNIIVQFEESLKKAIKTRKAKTKSAVAHSSWWHQLSDDVKEVKQTFTKRLWRTKDNWRSHFYVMNELKRRIAKSYRKLDAAQKESSLASAWSLVTVKDWRSLNPWLPLNLRHEPVLSKTAICFQYRNQLNEWEKKYSGNLAEATKKRQSLFVKLALAAKPTKAK